MKILIIAIIVGVGITIGSFTLFYPESKDFEIQNNEKIEYDETITIGIIHRDSEKMFKRYQPLADYLARELSDDTVIYKGIAKILPSEQQMIQSVNNGEIDIFFDSPLIGMKIASNTDLEPFLLSWKEGHRNYHSVFITSIDSDISFENLHGKTMIFEDRESTSGYFLPAIHLQKAGYDFDWESSKDFSYVFSLDDENTPIWILEGKGDVGATSNLDFEDIPLNIKEKLKIIESTESVPRQIIFVDNSFEFQIKLKEILLKMNETPETQEILKKISKINQFSEIDIEKDLKIINELMELIH
ncbi:MAG: phosphate/phosphite/phosphonate ABC transporter substrate-binding protein [Nitrosopumilus sp.]|nr:phosphate/phosphite/phosphonate ABC transporter substrate-binding protein [Nitrosopumilus sp.]MBL7014765.1 phosphate/phosphite/phosphonate ABC transporter substrate-binding protein [Nitrosopumilus sp.]MBL7017309.1 phosphate/phosphite/phosphonate ABC transporter substrate-binding protein [Nitrosopumilus sp.]